MRYLVLLTVILSYRSVAIAQQGCRSAEYKQESISRNPGLSPAIEAIERFTKDRLSVGSVVVAGLEHGGKILQPIVIPVVVHILYNSGAQNISDAQVQSQIAVLNSDYRKMNGDTSQIPLYYRDLAADCGINFALADIDTNGNVTTGIVRKHTSARSFSYDDAIKYTSRGGDNAWDRDRYLNIWVGNLISGVLGYSSVPGCTKETDGVVIHFTAFGTSGAATGPFNLGRTATHEIGHWLNLIHIWGDASCGDDRVDDTPQQSTATRGDPSGMIFTCGNTPFGNLYMDYMDFTDDIGMHLFTNGQNDRMRTLFADGGFRAALLNSGAVTQRGGVPGTPVPYPTDNGKMLSLYPNPAVQSVQVVTNYPAAIGSMLEVYNQRGQMVLSTRITNQSFQLNISPLSAGLYFVHVKDGNKNIPYKLVKM